MPLTPKIQKAIIVAAQKHLGMVRKGDGLPYIIHSYSVAWIVANYTEDEDTICAAFLHDVLEDVKNYRYDDLKKDFGENVANIVKDVSEDKDPNIPHDEKATWEERKAKYLKHLESASEPALIVSAADKIHNLQSLISAYQEQGPNVFSKFNAKPEKIFWFYNEVLLIIEKRFRDNLIKYYHETISKFEKIVKLAYEKNT